MRNRNSCIVYQVNFSSSETWYNSVTCWALRLLRGSVIESGFACIRRSDTNQFIFLAGSPGLFCFFCSILFMLVYYCTSHQVCMSPLCIPPKNLFQYVSLSQLRRGPISQISKRAAPRQLLWGRSSGGRWWTTPGSNKIIENQSRTLASPLLTTTRSIDLIDLLSNVMWKISWLFPAESNTVYCHTTIQ